MRFLTALLGIAASVYIGLSLYLYLYQENYVYFPDRQVKTTPDSIGLSYETLKIPTEDGETLDGWYIPAPAARATLLLFHGNAGNIGQRLDLIEIFHGLGLNVLIFDYRGYGASSGAPSEAGTYRDAAAAWRYLTETRHIPAAAIFLYGESLGGAIAAHLAQHHPARGLVLYAAFTGIAEMGDEYYPYLPTRLITRIRYDTRAALGAVSSPVLLLHSRDDEITPYRMAEALLAAAPQPKRLIELSGGHNDAPFTDREKFVKALDAFFTTPVAR